MSDGVKNNSVTDAEVDTLMDLLQALSQRGEVSGLANIVAATLRAMSAALHAADGGEACRANGGCVHQQEFGHTLTQAFASGKAHNVLANMELANVAVAASMAVAIMQPDEGPVTTPRAVLEDLADAFENIDSDPEGWEADRRRQRDRLEMEALLSTLQEMDVTPEDFGAVE